MRTGSTAIDAIVSDPPDSERKPKVIPAAPSAIPSGSRRSGELKTMASVIAIDRERRGQQDEDLRRELLGEAIEHRRARR